MRGYFKRIIYLILPVMGAAFVFTSCGTMTHDIKTDGSLAAIKLPPPRTHGGMPLMETLKHRRSGRAFSPKPLEAQVMADLLWAAFGINRPESGRRTAPSALNWQETDIYVFTEQGAYLYDAESNVLHPVVAGDFRGETGSLIQPFVKTAPVNLVYVVDAERTGLMGKVISTAERDMYSATAVGFIGQNVYLYCASEGMSTVVRGLVDRDALRQRLNLRPEQKVILAQSVGYPEDVDQAPVFDLNNVNDGRYPGQAPYDNQIYRVMVTVKNHRITSIDIVDIGSDEFREEAADAVREVLSDQSLTVDAVSGATPASQALLRAVEDALSEAEEGAK